MWSGFRLVRTVRLGMKNLLLHKMRSALTMLGIIFGVCSVIAMLAIGEGASFEAQEAIKRMGSANIILNAVKPPEDREASGSGNTFVLEYGLTYRDCQRIAGTIDGIAKVLPMRLIRHDIQYATHKTQCQVIGVLPSYPAAVDEELGRGRFFSAIEEQRQANVCVLSVGLADRLFPYQDPLDECVKIGQYYYRVVGILGAKSEDDSAKQLDTLSGRTWEDQVYIPLSTSRSLFGELLIRRTTGSYSAERIQLHRVIVKVASTEYVERVARGIEALLRHFHDRKDYEIIVPLRLLRQAEKTKMIFNIVLGSIAAISLLVGGIGIMNIMLATVTERTREIGIRRALGAKRQDIVVQFLVETVVMSVGGGLIGVAAGLGVPVIVERFTGMPTIVVLWAPLLAFSISGLVGVVSGLYPAFRAAGLDPIEALRHE